MARAKRTDRTEARRRHRAEQLALASADEMPEPEASEAAPAASRSRSNQPAGPGISNAFRAAFRPLDPRGDLAALPRLVRHWSLIVPVVITIATTALFIWAAQPLVAAADFSKASPFEGLPISGALNVALLLAQFFVYPPPVAGAFVVGFGAPRASWLTGLIQGLVAAVCFSIILMVPAGRLFGADDSTRSVLILQAFVLAPFGAAMFASAAAWYRRFLNLANPNRGRRPTGQQGRGGNRQRPRPAGTRSTARR